MICGDLNMQGIFYISNRRYVGDIVLPVALALPHKYGCPDTN